MNETMPDVAAAARNLSLKQWRRVRGRTRHEWKRAAEAIKDTWHLFGRIQEGAKNRAVQLFRFTVKRARRPLRVASGRRQDLADQWQWNRTEWEVERELARVVEGDHPVIVGPWLAEVGYEALYWVPFLQWVRTAYQLDPSRVVVVSRGGVASWYSDVATRYAEIWDYITPDEFARRNAERAEFKQSARAPLDDELIGRATEALSLHGARVLHPSLFFRLFRLYWSGHRPMGFIDAHTRFSLHAPPAIDLSGLPPEYVAVKLYAARALPETPQVREQVTRMVQALAERTPVVLLDTGLAVDDHSDYEVQSGGRIVSARHLMDARSNLGAQTAIVARAKAFVGTCGSIAWLAPRLGTDTTALFADPKFLHNHLSVAMRVSARLPGAGRFMPVDLRGVPV